MTAVSGAWADDGDALGGVFTISTSADRVYFSKGNLLQYESGQYKFADHQWDYVSQYNGDLFSWSSSGWGSQIGEGWRALSDTEWQYLLLNRKVIVGGESKASYGMGNVEGKNGLIILPDNWDGSVHSGFAYGAATWANVYSSTSSPTWAQMEAAGCVFLPAAGYYYSNTVNQKDVRGYYWSTTSGKGLTFLENNFNPYSGDPTSLGASVRLVRMVDTPDDALPTDGDGATLIASKADWEVFCRSVKAGNTYSGKTVKLTENITQAVFTTLGSFAGTFDGQGHTLKINTNTSPFRGLANGGVVKNLIVNGTVTATGAYASGLVGEISGSITVENCKVNVALTSSAGYAGGIVGHCGSGNTVNMTGCVFIGTMSSATGWNGGFVGWCNFGDNSKANTLNLTNCLFNGTFSGNGQFHPIAMKKLNTKITANLSNCYYTFGQSSNCESGRIAVAGTRVYSITAGTDVTSLAVSGTPTKSYDVSGLNFYSTALSSNGAFFAASGQDVPLALSHSDKEGYMLDQYTVTGGGTLANPETDEPTLTMTAANQTVSATYELIPTYTLSLADGTADKTNHIEVKVNDETVTPTEGKLTNVIEGSTIKITAKQGYKFREDSNHSQAYGICTYNAGESWPLGFITFNVDDPSNASQLNGSLSSYNGLDYCPADGYYYAVSTTSGDLVKMDLNGNVVATVATLNTEMDDGAWNPVNNTMYAMNDYTIYTINLSTGELNSIVTKNNFFYGIACNADGQLYTILGDGNLYTVNATTGELTLVGATGRNPNYVQSLQFDKKTGKLYWCYSDDDSDHFMQVDPTTGAATMLQESTGETTGLCFPGVINEITFTMPAADATLEYDIVRDMRHLMTTKVGDAADGDEYRIRLKKNGNDWELAEISLDDLKALITVHDGIENKDLAYLGPTAVCDLKIFALDDNDQPTGDAISFANLVPGRYVAKAIAIDGGYYITETALSNVIVLFQGYEVEVPAGEMITYYKDEPLYADPETSADAQLYTISSVSGDQAVLSDAIKTAKENPVHSLTPLVVYNPTDQDKTFLLIPTSEDPEGTMTFYNGFKGTLTDMTTEDTDTNGPWNMAEGTAYYAFNGKAFVYVRTALPVGANKCWLEMANATARSIRLVFGDATGINGANVTNETNEWYDLSGRRVAKPAKKGVYIQNGRKVVK